MGDTTNMEYSIVGPKTVSSQVSQMIVVVHSCESHNDCVASCMSSH